MKVPFRKKSSSRRSVPESAIAKPRNKGNHWENQWTHPDPEPGLPGICGYLNGIKEGPHPSRFKYVRPDGNPDDYVPPAHDHPGPADSDAPLSPSRRSVPRGFFGP